MLNLEPSLSALMSDPRVLEQLENQPSPFAQITLEAAEARLAQARRLVVVYADTMRVHLETNPVETHQDFLGEDPVNEALATLTDAVKEVLTGGLMQVRVAKATGVETALDSFRIIDNNIDECIELAHEEVVGVVEATIGRTLGDVRAAATVQQRMRAQAASTPVAEA